MNILLHGPLHISTWIYLMELLSEHKFYIVGDANFEEGTMPYSHLHFKPYTKEMEIDAQIVCLHLGLGIDTDNILRKIEDTYKFPIVWIEYATTTFRPKISTPIIYTCICNHRKDYPNSLLRHVFSIPSKTLWNMPWIGDKKQVFLPIRKPNRIHLDKEQREIVAALEDNGIKIEWAEGQTRQESFEQWKAKFVHSRILLDITTKYSSTTLNEGMMIGSPIVTSDRFDFIHEIRDGIDGFRVSTPEKAVQVCKAMLDDYGYAKEMGQKARKRADTILNPQMYRQIWNTALSDAIRYSGDLKSLKKAPVNISMESQEPQEKMEKIETEISKILVKETNTQAEVEDLQRKIRMERIMQVQFLSAPVPCKNCGASLVEREGDFAVCFKCRHINGNWIEYWEKNHREEL